MADIRIKDLTTTASSTASDDFIAVDGTTNGTRKLNAFSPTFGGNATVTGTLTTNGYTFTSGSLTSFSSTAGIYNYYSSGVGVLASYSDGSGTRAQTQISGSIVSLNTAAGNALTVSAAGVVAIPATTASTTTSTGALVVGNGTSGGLGVGGAVFTGGFVHPGGDSTFYIRGTGGNNGLIRGNIISADIDGSFLVRNGDGSSSYLSVASTGLIAAIPATAPSLTVNGTMTFERTSNTSLKISVRGTDGTTRSVSLTLA